MLMLIVTAGAGILGLGHAEGGVLIGGESGSVRNEFFLDQRETVRAHAYLYPKKKPLELVRVAQTVSADSWRVGDAPSARKSFSWSRSGDSILFEKPADEADYGNRLYFEPERPVPVAFASRFRVVLGQIYGSARTLVNAAFLVDTDADSLPDLCLWGTNAVDASVVMTTRINFSNAVFQPKSNLYRLRRAVGSAKVATVWQAVQDGDYAVYQRRFRLPLIQNQELLLFYGREGSFQRLDIWLDTDGDGIRDFRLPFEARRGEQEGSGYDSLLTIDLLRSAREAGVKEPEKASVAEVILYCRAHVSRVDPRKIFHYMAFGRPRLPETSPKGLRNIAQVRVRGTAQDGRKVYEFRLGESLRTLGLLHARVTKVVMDLRLLGVSSAMLSMDRAEFTRVENRETPTFLTRPEAALAGFLDLASVVPRPIRNFHLLWWSDFRHQPIKRFFTDEPYRKGNFSVYVRGGYYRIAETQGGFDLAGYFDYSKELPYLKMVWRLPKSGESWGLDGVVLQGGLYGDLRLVSPGRTVTHNLRDVLRDGRLHLGAGAVSRVREIEVRIHPERPGEFWGFSFRPMRGSGSKESAERYGRSHPEEDVGGRSEPIRAYLPLRGLRFQARAQEAIMSRVIKKVIHGPCYLRADFEGEDKLGMIFTYETTAGERKDVPLYVESGRVYRVPIPRGVSLDTVRVMPTDDRYWPPESNRPAQLLLKEVTLVEVNDPLGGDVPESRWLENVTWQERETAIQYEPEGRARRFRYGRDWHALRPPEGDGVELTFILARERGEDRILPYELEIPYRLTSMGEAGLVVALPTRRFFLKVRESNGVIRIPLWIYDVPASVLRIKAVALPDSGPQPQYVLVGTPILHVRGLRMTLSEEISRQLGQSLRIDKDPLAIARTDCADTLTACEAVSQALSLEQGWHDIAWTPSADFLVKRVFLESGLAERGHLPSTERMRPLWPRLWKQSRRTAAGLTTIILVLWALKLGVARKALRGAAERCLGVYASVPMGLWSVFWTAFAAIGLQTAWKEGAQTFLGVVAPVLAAHHLRKDVHHLFPRLSSRFPGREEVFLAGAGLLALGIALVPPRAVGASPLFQPVLLILAHVLWLGGAVIGAVGLIVPKVFSGKGHAPSLPESRHSFL